MLEVRVLVRCCSLTETIEVQLANKTTKVLMPEMGRKKIHCKFMFIKDNKFITRVTPPNNVVVNRVANELRIADEQNIDKSQR